MARRKHRTEEAPEEEATNVVDTGLNDTDEGQTPENPLVLSKQAPVFGPPPPVDSSRHLYRTTVPKLFVNGRNVKKGTYVELDDTTAERYASFVTRSE